MPAFTDHQQKAILARGNILVLAGAGAGKTRTLVERCIAWLLENRDHSLDHVLMVTFTDAAAAEMRHRIRAELEKRLQQETENTHLSEQLALLETAAISTLHSFCYQLVRQHFYELELDPQLVVMAEEESILLAEEILSTLLEKYFADPSARGEAVRHFILKQSRGWDRPVRRLILRLHHYVQTLPNPVQWLERELRLLQDSQPNHWHSWLTEAIHAWRTLWLPYLERESEANELLSECCSSLGRLHAGSPQSELISVLCGIYNALKDAPKGKKGSGYAARQFAAEVEFLHSLCFQENGNDPLLEDWNWTRPSLTTLLELTREFGEEFTRSKREMGVIDFHDLEQCSLRLLWNPEQGGPTALAQEWRKRFELIFVDEYQDINAVQDAILTALGRDGSEANRFLVGDVKQSIYRFRLAAPHIFQQYAANWGESESQGQVIALSDNFRSHEAVLAFVNPFFATLMRKEIGGVDYDRNAWLQFGDPQGRPAMSIQGSMAPETPDAANSEACFSRVELHLRLVGKQTEESGDDEGNFGDDALQEFSRAEQEARLVGLRLIQLRSEKRAVWIEREQQFRTLDWQDMVILLRSPRKKVESYAKEFARLGIPLLASRGGFFDSPEVSDLLSLLALLDNPLQDVPTLAVLRSPLVGLTLDELAAVRLAAKGRFWTALLQFHRDARRVKAGKRSRSEQAPTDESAIQIEKITAAAWPKVDLFLRHYFEWRRLARETSLSQCLERILNDTHYAAWLLTQSRDNRRRTNIPKLLTWARQFDQFHRQGLFRFLRFIEAQQAAEIDHDPAPVETENAVRLMSIHQSKGLEFPVVVAADLGKPFNYSDLYDDIILDEKYGLCPQVKPPFTERRYPSLPYWLAQRRQKQEALGEEMRVLYVALTRACNLLILAGTATHKNTEKWRKTTCSPQLQAQDILAARTWLDWIGPWLCESTGNPDWSSQSSGTCPLLSWTIYDDAETQQLRTAQAEGTQIESLSLQDADPKAVQDLMERLNWSYSFKTATSEPAKASVSVLRRRIAEDIPGESQHFFAPKTVITPPSGDQLSAAEVGTAHHIFLQFIDLEKVSRLPDIVSEADRMEEDGILTSMERGCLDLPAITLFWQSEVGQNILSQKSFIHRELSFTSRVSLVDIADLKGLPITSASDAQKANRKGSSRSKTKISKNADTEASLFSAGSMVLQDEFVIVQGVIDLAVLMPNEIWLLDFKTDRVSKKDWDEKVKFYVPQVKLYSLALSRIYQRPVANCWLHFLAVQQTASCSS